MYVRFRARTVRKDVRASSPERAVRSRDATETVKAEEITARAAIRETEMETVRVAIREAVTEEMTTVRAAIREAEMETVRAAIRETVTEEMTTARAAIRETEMETVRAVIRATETITVRVAIREAVTETVRAVIREAEMETVRAATREEMTTVRVEIEAAWAFRSRLSIHRLHRSSRIRSRARTLTRKSMTQRKIAISR